MRKYSCAMLDCHHKCIGSCISYTREDSESLVLYCMIMIETKMSGNRSEIDLKTVNLA